MKKQSLLICLCFCTFFVNAQSTFQKTIGNPFSDNFEDIHKTKDKGFIVVGNSYINDQNEWDVYAAKYDKNFNLEWTSAVGGTIQNGQGGYDEGYSVTQTADEGYLITGITSSFDNTTSLYLVRLKKNGTIKWTKNLSDKKNNYGKSIIETDDGGFLLSGTTSTKVNVKSRNMFVAKLNSDGDIIWEKLVGGPLADEATCATETTDGYVVAGYTYSFGNGQKDMYVVKLDFNGNLLWSRAIGGASDDDCNAIKTTTDNGLMLLGTTNSYGVGGDFLFVKLDNNGTLLTSKIFGGPYADAGFDIIKTKGGGYALSGNYTLEQFKTARPCIVKIDDMGNLTWRKVIENYTDLSFGGISNGLIQSEDSGYIVGTEAYYLSPSFNANLGMHKFNKNGNFCGDNVVAGSISSVAVGIANVASVITTLDFKLKKQTSLYSSSGTQNTLCTNAAESFAKAGSDKATFKSVVSIKPNPVKDIATIELNLPQQQNIHIYITDLSGESRIQKQFAGQKGINTFKIDVSHLYTGNYYIKLIVGDKEVLFDKMMKL